MSDPTPSPSTLEDATVGIDWWANFYGVTPYTVRGWCLAAANGRLELRIPPPLPVDKPYRWLKSAALAHVDAMSKGAKW